MAPIADDDSPDRRVESQYRAGDERTAALGMGSGDVELEAAITKLRGSIIRTVNELDRFSMTVRRAREHVAAMADLKDEVEPHEHE